MPDDEELRRQRPGNSVGRLLKRRYRRSNRRAIRFSAGFFPDPFRDSCVRLPWRSLVNRRLQAGEETIASQLQLFWLFIHPPSGCSGRSTTLAGRDPRRTTSGRNALQRPVLELARHLPIGRSQAVIDPATARVEEAEFAMGEGGGVSSPATAAARI